MTHDASADSLRHQAVSGVFWTVLQKWSVRLSTFLAFLVLGRLLSPKEFGVVALASTFIVLMTTLADAGFATYLVQERDLSEEAKNTAFYIATGSGCVLFVVGSAIAYPLSRVLDVPELATVLPVLASTLVLIGLSSVPAALLTRELQFQALAMRQVLATVLSVIVAVVLAIAGAGVWALVLQFVVLRLVTTVVLWFASDFTPRRGFSRGEARKMLSYSLKAMGAQLLSQARDQGEVLLIGAIAGPVALGLWTVAGRLVLVVGDLLGNVLGTVAVPLFARVQADPRRLGRAISGTSSLGMILMAPALVLLALLSERLIPQVFGDQWRGATAVASLLAIRGVFIALSQLDRSVLLNAGLAGRELKVIAWMTALHVLLISALAAQGVQVLAVALLAEAVLLQPVRPVLLHRWLSVPYSAYSGALRVGAATGLAGFATYGAKEALGATGNATYLVVLGVGSISYPILVLLLARPMLKTAVSTMQLLLRRKGARGPAAV